MTHLRSAIAGLTILLLFLGACGGKSPQEEATTPAGASVLTGGATVRSIDLVYDGLEPDRKQRLEAYGAADLLRSNLESNLREGGKLNPSGDLEVVVSIESFRLRSSAATFWLGMMAGSDSVVADVRVMREGKSVKSFETNTSSVMGGIAYASGAKRTRRLMNTLARRIVEGI